MNSQLLMWTILVLTSPYMHLSQTLNEEEAKLVTGTTVQWYLNTNKPKENVALCFPCDLKISSQGKILFKADINYMLCCFSLQSCHHRIQELFSDKIYLIGIAALAVAVIMVRTWSCTSQTSNLSITFIQKHKECAHHNMGHKMLCWLLLSWQH